jgi:hypothetical protein
MSPKQTIASLRSRARKAGIRLGMAKLNDAIAKALYQRAYSSLVASERAGKVLKPDLDQARAVRVANEYSIPSDDFIHALAWAFSENEDLEVRGILTLPSWFRGFLHRGPRPFNERFRESEVGHRSLLTISRQGAVSLSCVRSKSRPIHPGRWTDEAFYIHVPRDTNGQALWTLLVGDAQPLIAEVLSSYPVEPKSLAYDDPRSIAYRKLVKLIRALPRDNAMLVYDWMDRHAIRELWPAGMSPDDAIKAIRAAFPFWNGTATSSPCFDPEPFEVTYEEFISRVILSDHHDLDRWHARYAVISREWDIESYARFVCQNPGSNLEAEAMLDAQIPSYESLSLDFTGITEEQSRNARLAIERELKRRGVSETRLVIARSVHEKGGAAFEPDLRLWDELERIALAAALPHADAQPSDVSLTWDYALGAFPAVWRPPLPTLRTVPDG